VNSNAVTQGPRASSKSPELLARYCDMLLKKRCLDIVCTELDSIYNLKHLNNRIQSPFSKCTCTVLA